MKRALIGVLVLTSLASAPCAAQQPRPRALRAQQAPAGRAQLEAEIRRRFSRAVRVRVGLTEEQMRRLAPITSKYEGQRRALQVQERSARLSLRDALRDETSADQRQVDGLLQQLVDIQKQRVQLLDAEQRELGTVMTPVQRAKFLALQEQVRRRLEQMRQRRMQILEGTSGATPP